jgi:hypothetical protein
MAQLLPRALSFLATPLDLDCQWGIAVFPKLRTQTMEHYILHSVANVTFSSLKIQACNFTSSSV